MINASVNAAPALSASPAPCVLRPRNNRIIQRCRRSQLQTWVALRNLLQRRGQPRLQRVERLAAARHLGPRPQCGPRRRLPRRRLSAREPGEQRADVALPQAWVLVNPPTGDVQAVRKGLRGLDCPEEVAAVHPVEGATAAACLPRQRSPELFLRGKMRCQGRG
jgi:hypothetical protein